MIESEQLIAVGRINKPHGLKGEMNVTVTDDVFDRVERCPYFICEMDGIYVPFFITTYRFRTESTMLLQLDGVESQEAALEFAGRDLYFDKRCFTPAEQEDYETAEEEELGLVGYTVIDEQLGALGTITAIDDQTENVLFIVDHNGEELLVPAADDLVTEVDDETHTIRMDLPPGLVNLDEAEVGD
jgi:16S rRNA processing protein RimM